MIPKQVDSKGRIVLDKVYAGTTMLVELREDGSIVLRPAVTVPENEAWLWKNQKALAAVQAGLEGARAGRREKGPNMSAGAKVAGRAKD